MITYNNNNNKETKASRKLNMSQLLSMHSKPILESACNPKLHTGVCLDINKEPTEQPKPPQCVYVCDRFT